LSKGKSFIITSYHFIGPYNRCETILSFLPKCQICLPMQILLIISHNSPSTNQANLVLLKASYTITFIVPDNMENVRKAILTKLRLVKLALQWCQYIFCPMEVIM